MPISHYPGRTPGPMDPEDFERRADEAMEKALADARKGR